MHHECLQIDQFVDLVWEGTEFVVREIKVLESGWNTTNLVDAC